MLTINLKKMFAISQKVSGNSRFKSFVFALAAALIIVLPMFAFSSREEKIYVDTNNSGEQTGSISKPFRTIAEAMAKAGKDTEIHIANGTYTENIDIKAGVEILGESRRGVVIVARNKKEPVASMRHGSKINKVTIRGGSYGIKVRDNAKASIIKCLIKDNGKDGIMLENGDLKVSRQASISENIITNNDGAGIFSQKRKLSIVDNEIRGNDSDGVDLEKGSVAWIADNDIKNNGGSGMKLRLDGSNIWTNKNSITSNDHEGIEISFRGRAGRIDISKSEILRSGRYGVARVQRELGPAALNLWGKYLTFDNQNKFGDNKRGNASDIIVIK